MSLKSVAGNVHDLESLRITHRPEASRAAPRRPYFYGMILGIIALAAIGGYAVYEHTAGRPLTVQTVTVDAGRDQGPQVILTGSGYIVTSHKYITIGTKVLGQIVEEPIEEGLHVHKGELLARIDDRDYQAQLRQALADRDLAKANVQVTSSRAARADELFRGGILSRDELETTGNAAQVAQAILKRNEAAIDYAQFMVSQCVIRSPINGVVLRRYRELGDTINYGGQVQAGGGATDIAQLADTADIRAEVDINETDIARVAIGTPATVVLDAYTSRRFDASLVKIYPEADRQKGTVKVEVRIQDPDLRIIKPEMSVKTNFLESSNAVAEGPRIIVPAKAVVNEGSASYVWVIRKGLARRAAILRGSTNENGVKVRQGLSDGDIIIVTPPSGLLDGQKVSPDHKKSATYRKAESPFRRS